MKKVLTLGLGLVAMSLSISACSQEGAKPENESPVSEEAATSYNDAANESAAMNVADAKTVKVSIEGMTCTSCVGRVDEALADIAGVASKNVSLEDNQCTVTFDPAQTDEKQIVAAIEKLEYKAELIN